MKAYGCKSTKPDTPWSEVSAEDGITYANPSDRIPAYPVLRSPAAID